MIARQLAGVVVAFVAISAIAGGPARSDAPPATLVSGDPSHDAAKLDPVFAHFKLDRLEGKFSEEKHIALLARPLKSTGTIYFDHDKGIARITVTPKRERVVVTKTSLRIEKNNHTDEIPLDKSKDLKAFALVFPALLRGDRAEIEHTFSVGLYGSEHDWWALTFTPSAESLRKMVRRVIVFGRKGELISLQVVEASGDTTDTQLTDIHTNSDVAASEIATAFGN